MSRVELRVLELIAEFEERLEEYALIPFTGRVLVNREEFLSIIQEIKEILPEEYEYVRHAYSTSDDLIRNAEKYSKDLVNNTQNECRAFKDDAERLREQMITDAKMKAAKLLDEHEITKKAQKKGESIVNEANLVSNKIIQDAKDQALSLLTDTVQKVAVIQNEIQKELKRFSK